jgi:hypothetical protein
MVFGTATNDTKTQGTADPANNDIANIFAQRRMRQANQTHQNGAASRYNTPPLTQAAHGNRRHTRDNEDDEDIYMPHEEDHMDAEHGNTPVDEDILSNASNLSDLTDPEAPTPVLSTSRAPVSQVSSTSRTLATSTLHVPTLQASSISRTTAASTSRTTAASTSHTPATSTSHAPVSSTAQAQVPATCTPVSSATHVQPLHQPMSPQTDPSNRNHATDLGVNAAHKRTRAEEELDEAPQKKTSRRSTKPKGKRKA